MVFPIVIGKIMISKRRPYKRLLFFTLLTLDDIMTLTIINKVIYMKIWKLTESVYAIKERLGPETYKKVISIDGVNYSKKKWRIQFRGDRIDKIREVVDEVEIIKGYDLIDKLYRISKFKPRKGLMKHSVVIY